MPRHNPLQTALAALRDYALTFPYATEDHPWGETAIKVKGKKVFVFLSLFKEQFRVSAKLPVSSGSAVEMTFAEPTGYGLGKHGWVTATFSEGDMVPVDLLREWINESYRAVAPKSVLAKLESSEDAAKTGRGPARKRKA